MSSSKFFFFDTNAIARYYCNDIGSHIIKQIMTSENGLIMSNYSYVEVVSALAQIARDTSFPSFGNSELNQTLPIFESEFDSRFVQIPIDDEQFKKAVELIKKYTIKSADALIVASSLILADKLADEGHKLIFVTSDKQPYNVALAEANYRSNYSAFHFWKCNCPNCGQLLEVKKAKNITCSCGYTRCEQCVIGNCTNSLTIDLNTL